MVKRWIKFLHPLRKWADPTLLAFAAILGGSAILASLKGGENPLQGLLFQLFIVGLALLATALLPSVQPRSLTIPAPRREAIFAVIYLAAWFLFAWNFGGLVNEASHWITLVALPILLLHLLRHSWEAGGGFRETLHSIGITWQNLGPSLKLALVVGLLAAPVVVWGSAKQEEVVAAIRSGRALYLFPLSFILMLFMAGFTEEVFFRGLLQARLAAAFGSEVRGLLVATVLFGLYHLPYAYHLRSWPSYGDLVWSVSQAIVEGAAGLLLGTLWLRTRNLFGGVFLHAFLNAFVVMTMLNFSIKFGG